MADIFIDLNMLMILEIKTSHSQRSNLHPPHLCWVWTQQQMREGVTMKHSHWPRPYPEWPPPTESENRQFETYIQHTYLWQYPLWCLTIHSNLIQNVLSKKKKPMGIQTTKPTTSKKIWTQLNIMKNVTFNFTNIIHRTCEQLIIIRSVNNPDRGRPQIGGQPPIEVHHTSIGDGLSGSKLLQENAYFSDCNNNCDWQRRMEIPRRSGLFL